MDDKKKLNFELNIHSIKIDYKIPFNFKLLLKGNNQNIEFDKIYKYDCSENFIEINEKISLTIEEEIFYNKVNNFKFKIYLCIFTKSGFKPAISEEINFENIPENKEILLSNKTFNKILIRYNLNNLNDFENSKIKELNLDENKYNEQSSNEDNYKKSKIEIINQNLNQLNKVNQEDFDIFQIEFNKLKRENSELLLKNEILFNENNDFKAELQKKILREELNEMKISDKTNLIQFDVKFNFISEF